MEPAYTLQSGEGEYRQAIDLVIGLARRDLVVFDNDLSALRLEDPGRTALLDSFIAGDRARRIRIVVHNPDVVTRKSPRLMQLLSRFSHQLEVRQTPENLRHLADTHVIADGEHGVRRFQYNQPRFATMLADPAGLKPWSDRFEELWIESHPCVSANATGL